jgi:CheY-like chemotaxis protein
MEPMAQDAVHRHGVLVVEDDYGTRESFLELARLYDLDATGAANGRQALTKLRQGLRPCLIILDLTMPEMDGLEFREAQLADPAFAEIPVAVMSGGGLAAEEEARKLGLVHYLRKPIEIDTLLRLFADNCGARL